MLALPDVVAFDLTIATEVFGRDHGDRYQVKVCAVRPGPVQRDHFDLVARDGLEALAWAETVIVPGFSRAPTPADAVDALRAAAARGARIASICTGAFALADAGLLDGLGATTHWQYAAELARRHPLVEVKPGVLYVDNGQILTSAGLAAGLDLCLHLFTLDHGEAAAITRARALVTPLHRAGGQAQFIPTDPGLGRGSLSSVTAWATHHLAEPIGVPELARQAEMAPRTFARRFTADVGLTPHAWLSQLRLQAACRLLEHDDCSVEEVARRSGLGSSANLRLHFHRAYATTPTAYRATFAGTA